MSANRPDDNLVAPPQQDRSRETLERILDATETLLATKQFAEISVQEIVGAAGTSVGAFYGRFRDKNALLPLLYDRYDRWVAASSRALAGPLPKELTLERVASWTVRAIMRFFEERRNLLRAIAVYARQEGSSLPADVARDRERQMAFLREALLRCRKEIKHPNPDRAVSFAIFTAVTSCREYVLFNESPQVVMLKISPRVFIRETAAQISAYLRQCH